MSVRLGTTVDTDRLHAQLAAALTMSGDFMLAIWAKHMVQMATFLNVVQLSDHPTSPTVPLIGMVSSSSDGLMDVTIGPDSFQGLTGDWTVGVWRYLTMGRTGTTGHLRVFADSTSTTPISDSTYTDASAETTVDAILIGDNITGREGCANAELESLKIHTGTYWSNAECRTESQKYAIQKAGGSERFAVRLADLSATTDGRQEIGGAWTMTNVGSVVGASRPTQLEALGGDFTAPFPSGLTRRIAAASRQGWA